MYLELLKKELIPAMGCTEPIAIAYAAALAKDALGELPTAVDIIVSGNIIKNVKSVIVPNTGGLRGIKAAVAAGLVAGEAHKQLEVLSAVTPEDIERTKAYLEKKNITVKQAESERIFEIDITVRSDAHTARVCIYDDHTNVVLIRKDEEILVENKSEASLPDMVEEMRGQMSVEGIVEYAKTVDIQDVKPILDRQIQYNWAIAEEGIRNKYGANIGKVLLSCGGRTVANRAKAYASAGSDARMSGCEMPVVINSGSGNQGITASVPVIVYARELGVSDETLYRALTISNLVSIHLKTGIGCLSAYCGATSAAVGAACGITYLYGGEFEEIAHTIVNGLAINSGMVCDGAKASCAAKIASAIESALLGMNMYKRGYEFVGGDGIITKGVENTIVNIGELARIGMRETDREIIKIMMK